MGRGRRHDKPQQQPVAEHSPAADDRIRIANRISLRQMRYFQRAVEQASITRAAEQLGIAQSAVTDAIRTLEAELGTPLLNRLPNGVEPTFAGQVFLDHVRAILRQIEDAVGAVRGIGDAAVGELVLGCSSTLFTYVLGPILVRCREQFPELRIVVRDMATRDLDAALRRDEIDIAFCNIADLVNDEGFCIRPLFRTCASLWVAPDHRLAGCKEVAFADLAGEPIIAFDYSLSVDKLRTMFAQGNITPNIIHRAGNIETVRNLVADNIGAAMIADFAWRPRTVDGKRIVRIEVSDNRISWAHGLVWRADRAPLPAAKIFADLLTREILASYPPP